jgi:hypothetical protein
MSVFGVPQCGQAAKNSGVRGGGWPSGQTWYDFTPADCGQWRKG